MRFSSLLPFCGFLFLLQPVLSQSPAALPARNGIIDLRGSDLLNQTISLNGQWNIYWRKLLLPGDTNTIKPGTANFPGLWNNTVVEGNGLTAKGFATYTLTVLLPAHSRPLAMAVPDFYTSYRLFVNGRE
ncbi:MAG TPA: hypothetical protein VKI61_03220, partial [Chitinophagaceae bacterium]|nr:hypothetical protein [Chitinophagaceae bacterium]